jgi:hypothetical protein
MQEEAIASVTCRRREAVLNDMREIGKKTSAYPLNINH